MPLYEALYRAIRADIVSGTLQPGEKLPSKRALSRHLELGKTTVEAAYAQLLDEGYLVSREKVGYFVEKVRQEAPMQPLPCRETPQPPEPEIDLTANGTGHFPFTVWSKLQRRVVLDQGERLLLPVHNQGDPALRQAIADHLRNFRGMQVQAENILVGAGTDFLYNVIVQLLGRQRGYALEDPGYPKLRSIYAAAGADCYFLPVEESGVVAGIPPTADVVHVSPSHHFPTGLVMSMQGRRELIAWAEQGDRYLIEDDFDSEFRQSVHPKPAMQSMNPERVIYMNSFSKSLAPSIRISFLVLPPKLQKRFQETLGFYACTVPSFEQHTLALFLSEGYFEKHINRMRRFYAARRRELLELLADSPISYRLTVLERDAGLHFILKLDTALSDDALTAALAEQGIRARMLSQYYKTPASAPSRQLLVDYSGLTRADFQETLNRLEPLL